jgi:hypothetical protein
MADDKPAEEEEELLDYEEEEEAPADAAGAKTGEAVKKGYVGIHSTGFRDFLLKPELLRAIVDCGFEHPSEGAYASLRNSLFPAHFDPLRVAVRDKNFDILARESLIRSVSRCLPSRRVSPLASSLRARPMHPCVRAYGCWSVPTHDCAPELRVRIPTLIARLLASS